MVRAMKMVAGGLLALLLLSGAYFLRGFLMAAPVVEPELVTPASANAGREPVTPTGASSARAVGSNLTKAAEGMTPAAGRPLERIPLSGPELCHRYSVRSGDTAASIAQSHGSSLARLLAANPELEGKAFVERGQELNIPCIVVEEQNARPPRPAPTERYKITDCEKGRTKGDWEMPVASVVRILKVSLSNDAFEWAVEAYWQCAEKHHSPLVSLNVTREVNDDDMSPRWMVDVASLAVGARKWLRVIETPGSSYTAHIWERVGDEYVQYYAGGPYVFSPCMGEDRWDATGDFFSFRMRDEWSRLPAAVRKFVCNELGDD
jgi:LysM repeat protein